MAIFTACCVFIIVAYRWYYLFYCHQFVCRLSQIIKHLAFRDYLINNKNAAEEYAEIKRAAVLASDNDVHRYSAFKTAFIEHHLRLALTGAACLASHTKP